MQKHLKELIIILIQLFMFYIFPLFAVPTDIIGMILLITATTFILSVTFGLTSKTKLKYLYPIIISTLFIPSVFIYYNESALIHSVWYLVISITGLLVGIIINNTIKWVNK